MFIVYGISLDRFQATALLNILRFVLYTAHTRTRTRILNL